MLTRRKKPAILFNTGRCAPLGGLPARVSMHGGSPAPIRSGAFCIRQPCQIWQPHAPRSLPDYISSERTNATKRVPFCCVRVPRIKRLTAATKRVPFCFVRLRAAPPSYNILPYPTISARGCQAFLRPAALRRNLQRAIKRWSAIAYIIVTASPPWFRARRTRSMSPYFLRSSTA